MVWRARVGAWAAAAAVCACTVESEGTTVGVVTAGPMTAGSGSATASATSTGATGETDGAQTQGSGEDSSSGGAVATSTGDSGDSTTGPMADPQPADGMYSHCVQVSDCVGLTTCVLATDDDGYCSANGCMDPLADCDPSPGGTATPTCIEYAVQIVPEDVCALDCSGGATCPGGMECQDVQGNLVCV